MKNSKVFTIRCHGGAYEKTYSESDGTFILLNDEKGTDQIVLCSHYTSINSNSLYISSDDSFANSDLIIFIGCQTGYGGETGNNLPTVVVEQGAKVSVGSSSSIDCKTANT